MFEYFSVFEFSIFYNLKISDQISQFLPLRKIWFGSSSFCKTIKSHYRDNSLEKSTRMKWLQRLRSEKLEDDYYRVSSSLSVHKNINSRVDLFSKQLSSYFNSVSDMNIEEIKMQGAAVVIQKHVRGYLARCKYARVKAI